MKKLLILFVISLFLLAACEPGGITTVSNQSPTDDFQMTEELEPVEPTAVDTEIIPSAIPTNPQVPSETPNDRIQSQTDTIEITINNNSFESDEWVIHEYAQIKWTNLDDVTHTIIVVKTHDSWDDLSDPYDDYDDDYQDDDGEYKNSFEITLLPGQSFSYRFDDDGRYEFSLAGVDGLVGIIHVSDDYGDDDYNDDWYDDDDYYDDDDDYDDDEDSYDNDNYGDDDYDDDDNDDYDNDDD